MRLKKANDLQTSSFIRFRKTKQDEQTDDVGSPQCTSEVDTKVVEKDREAALSRFDAVILLAYNRIVLWRWVALNRRSY